MESDLHEKRVALVLEWINDAIELRDRIKDIDPYMAEHVNNAIARAYHLLS